MDDEKGLTAMQVAQAANALRLTLRLPAEVFPFGQALSMLGDELREWRARGFSDEAFAAAIHEATGVALPAGLIARV